MYNVYINVYISIHLYLCLYIYNIYVYIYSGSRKLLCVCIAREKITEARENRLPTPAHARASLRFFIYFLFSFCPLYLLALLTLLINRGERKCVAKHNAGTTHKRGIFFTRQQSEPSHQQHARG